MPVTFSLYRICDILAITSASALFSTECFASDMASKTVKQDLSSLIEYFATHGTPSRTNVEAIIGRPLVLVKNGAPAYYEAKGAKYRHIYIGSVRYWPGPAESSPAVGPLLEISLEGDCISRSYIFDAYNPSDSVTLSTPTNLGADSIYGRNEVWGSLRFGFSARSPQCLSTIGIDMRAPPPRGN